jgi:hypothetical protein
MGMSAKKSKSVDKQPKPKLAEAPKLAGGITPTAKASAAVGLLAGCVFAVLVNVAAARSFKRWDVTSSQLYSLSTATKTTLHDLGEPVTVTVLLAASDPLSVSVHHLLTAYQAESARLVVRTIDPDRSPAEFLAFQKQHGILAGQTQDGHVVADATLVVTRGDKTWFLGPADLIDLSELDEGRSRPKLEQALTTAIRNVLSGDRTTLCFTKGHGEIGLNEGGKSGLSELAHRLARNNYDTVEVETTGAKVVKDPFKACQVAIVAAPQQSFTTDESSLLTSFVEQGGNVLFLLNPIPDAEKRRVAPSGLEPVMALFGVVPRGDLVIERDSSRRLPKGSGEVFFGEPHPHPISQGLVDDPNATNKILFVLAQSFGRVTDGPSKGAVATEVVVTSKDSFAMGDFFNWRDDGTVPERKEGERSGPLAVVMASELPAKKGDTAANDAPARSQRGVFIGSVSVAQGQAFSEPILRGGAILVESSVSWLSARPEMVDIPPKPSMPAGLRLTEEAVGQVRTYVTIYVPLAVALVGVAVFLRRRSTERGGGKSSS